MNTAFCLLTSLLVLLLAAGAIVAWALESPADRARRWHRSGWSQRAIAGRLGVSRYRVRCYLAAA